MSETKKNLSGPDLAGGVALSAVPDGTSASKMFLIENLACMNDLKRALVC
jgi:hypothetical protein